MLVYKYIVWAYGELSGSVYSWVTDSVCHGPIRNEIIRKWLPDVSWFRKWSVDRKNYPQIRIGGSELKIIDVCEKIQKTIYERTLLFKLIPQLSWANNEADSKYNWTVQKDIKTNMIEYLQIDSAQSYSSKKTNEIIWKMFYHQNFINFCRNVVSFATENSLCSSLLVHFYEIQLYCTCFGR